MSKSPVAATEDQRHETVEERFDRNTIELLNEIRVASTGIQVMFGFLLIAPFDTGFQHTSTAQRTIYFVTLGCVAAAAVLLMAPSIHHRILFRHGEKGYLVTVANRFAVVAMVFLCAGFTGSLALVSNVLLGGVASAMVGGVAVVVIAGVWFAVPLVRAAREPRLERGPGRRSCQRSAVSSRADLSSSTDS